MYRWKYLLTGFILILLILAVMPAPAQNCSNNPQYPHRYYSTNDCKMLICEVCGDRKGQAFVIHEFAQIDCYRRQCTRCGLIEEYEIHQRFCSTVRQCADCGKKFEKISPGNHVWKHQNTDCTRISVCTLCGEKKIYQYGNHKWAGENCEEGLWCRLCGVRNSKPTEHAFYTNLAGLITNCGYCDYMEITASSADWFLMAAWLLGLLWVSLAFGYTIRNRRTFSLDRNILRSTWQDCGETAPNLRSWRS